MTKQHWQDAYNQQPDPHTLQGGIRQLNGYLHPRSYAMLRESLRRATRTWQHRHILDAGCGSGDTGAFLTAQNRVTGLDFSHQMARHARRNYPAVLLGDVETLPFPKNQFDGLLAVGVWQCLAPNTPFLREAARVVKPNGEVVLGWVLNHDYLLYRRGLRFRLDPRVELSLLTAPQAVDLLHGVGLEVLELFPVLFPVAVLRAERLPALLRPLVPAFTVRCRVR